MSPTEDDSRRLKENRSQNPNEARMCESVDVAEQEKRGMARERVQSGESDTESRGGERTYRVVRPAPPPSPREADTSLHPCDRSQEGGMNGGVERR